MRRPRLFFAPGCGHPNHVHDSVHNSSLSLLLHAFCAWLCFVSALAPAASEIEPARVKEITGMLPAKPAGFGPQATDRAAWEKLARVPAFAAVVSQARKLAKE